MKCEFTIYTRLPTFNDYTYANRSHWSVGNGMKADAEASIMMEIPPKLKNLKLTNFKVFFVFFEPDYMRDEDGIKAVGHKMILDALVKTKVIANDSRKHLLEIVDTKIHVDKKNPRVEISLEVVKEDGI